MSRQLAEVLDGEGRREGTSGQSDFLGGFAACGLERRFREAVCFAARERDLAGVWKGVKVRLGQWVDGSDLERTGTEIARSQGQDDAQVAMAVGEKEQKDCGTARDR